jgi:enamine deaminase RidA (YjgF/YER057c/UK114 family)
VTTPANRKPQPATYVSHHPADVAAPEGGYAHAIELSPRSRLLFISGQIPVRPDGSVPPDFESQCQVVWDNIIAVLASARMNVEHLVKVTTYLTNRDQVEANGQIRRERLGANRPALTVVVVQTLLSDWLLEIEAVAAA